MKPAKFDYIAADTLPMAIALLNDTEDARVIAGGQSLIPMMAFRLARPSVLIDLNRVRELQGISRHSDGSIVVGALTRHRAFEHSYVIGEALPLLSHATRFIAHVQIRNRGTIGGSLVHSDPAAEWPALCMACAAEYTIVSVDGIRRVSPQDFVRAPMETDIQLNEILSEIRFPAWPGDRRWGFQELSRRRGDYALAGAVCTVDINPSGQCSAARIVLFGATSTPYLATEAAEALVGKNPDLPLLTEVSRLAINGIELSSDEHASSQYRSSVMPVLVRRALAQAFSFPLH